MAGLVQNCPTCGVDDQASKHFDLKDSNNDGFELQHPQQAYQIHAIHFYNYWRSCDAGDRTMQPVERDDAGESRLTNNLPDNTILEVSRCAKATPAKVGIQAEIEQGNVKTSNSRIISRPLNGIRSIVGPIRHDAVLIREGTDFYILERVGPEDATNDAKKRKVVPQEQILNVRYGPGSNSAPRLVDELGPGVKSSIFFTYAGSGLGNHGDDNFIFLSPRPEVRFSDEEQRDSSCHTASWATNQDTLRIKLKNETGEIEEWSTRVTVDHWVSGRPVKEHILEMQDYAERHPYYLGQFDCQDFVQQSNNLNGIKNPTRGHMEALMYSGAKLIPRASLPAGRPAQEPPRDTMPMQISLERFFIHPHHPGNAASESLPNIPNINLQLQHLPPHGEPGFGRPTTPSFSAERPAPCPDQEVNSNGCRIRSQKVKVKAGMGVGVSATLGAVAGGCAASLTVGGIPFTLTTGISLTTGAPYLAIGCANPIVGLAMFGGMVLATAILASGNEEED